MPRDRHDGEAAIGRNIGIAESLQLPHRSGAVRFGLRRAREGEAARQAGGHEQLLTMGAEFRSDKEFRTVMDRVFANEEIDREDLGEQA